MHEAGDFLLDNSKIVILKLLSLGGFAPNRVLPV